MKKAEEEKIYTLGFSFVPSIGPAKFRKLKKFFGSTKLAWLANYDDLKKSGIGDGSIKSLLDVRKNTFPKKEFEKILDTETSFITEEDKSFPSILKEIHSSPFILFYQGNLEVLQEKVIAIVGPRLPTHYGENVAHKFANKLSSIGVVIASGMAQGVDSIAHSACIENNKPTVAVLGCGIETARSQKRERELINSIISKGGVVISEYTPFTKSAKHTFPARNRIVSGLSLGTVIVEASQRSGTLITARLTLEQNRELFVVPGNIFSEKSIGTNDLLKKGAMPTTCTEDILNCLNFASSAKPKKEKELAFNDKTEKEIYQKLSTEPMHVDQLAKKLDIDHSTLLSKLSLLELTGAIQNIGGNMFIRK